MTYYERHRKDKSLKGERTIMPKVNGKKFPYTKKGKKAAKKAKKGFNAKSYENTKKKVFGM